MCLGREPELRLRLRQRDVKPALARPRALDKKAQRHRGLARPGTAFEQEDAPRCQPAQENIVEARNSGAILRFSHLGVHDPSPIDACPQMDETTPPGSLGGPA